MRYYFKTKQLAELFSSQKGAQKYPASVVTAFFEVMSVISAMPDERDLYNLKGLHFEKLKGTRKHERSIRLEGQFRLIITIERDAHGKYIFIIQITDYH